MQDYNMFRPGLCKILSNVVLVGVGNLLVIVLMTFLHHRLQTFHGLLLI